MPVGFNLKPILSSRQKAYLLSDFMFSNDFLCFSLGSIAVSATVSMFQGGNSGRVVYVYGSGRRKMLSKKELLRSDCFSKRQVEILQPFPTSSSSQVVNVEVKPARNEKLPG